MRHFLDCEFHEDGTTIDLISMALVCEDGREFYEISSEFNEEKARANPWLRDNVLSKIEGLERRPRARIREDLLEFVGPEKPEIWGYYADYDWICVAQLFGRMIGIPKHWPKYCRDLKQLADSLGNPKLPAEGKDAHTAIADARWNRKAYDFLAHYRPPKPDEKVEFDMAFKEGGVAMRRFFLRRLNDQTGVSRTGRVLEGVLCQDGQVMIQWRPPLTSMAIYKDLETFRKIHMDCHPSANELVWIDPDPRA